MRSVVFFFVLCSFPPTTTLCSDRNPREPTKRQTNTNTHFERDGVKNASISSIQTDGSVSCDVRKLRRKVGWVPFGPTSVITRSFFPAGRQGSRFATVPNTLTILSPRSDALKHLGDDGGKSSFKSDRADEEEDEKQRRTSTEDVFRSERDEGSFSVRIAMKR